MGNVLYVGGDDSNHAGDAKGEFIVAAFSLKHEDSLVKGYPNRRNNQVVSSWLESGGDYRFAICAGKKYNGSQNLPLVVPSLIKAYIEQVDFDVEVLKVYLDGRLDGGFRSNMRKELLGIRGLEKVVVDNFIKKRIVGKKTVKGYCCPKVVWLADSLANELYNYSGPVSDLLVDERMVRI